MGSQYKKIGHIDTQMRLRENDQHAKCMTFKRKLGSTWYGNRKRTKIFEKHNRYSSINLIIGVSREATITPSLRMHPTSILFVSIARSVNKRIKQSSSTFRARHAVSSSIPQACLSNAPQTAASQATPPQHLESQSQHRRHEFQLKADNQRPDVHILHGRSDPRFPSCASPS